MHIHSITCDGCQKATKGSSNHWFLIDPSANEITVTIWSENAAKHDRYEHICGESCLQKRISQWAETRVGA